MGRKFVVLAALAAVTLSMSACKCPAPAPASSSSSGGGAAAAGTAGGGTVCLDDTPSAKDFDGTSTYRSERDRNMSNMVDRKP